MRNICKSCINLLDGCPKDPGSEDCEDYNQAWTQEQREKLEILVMFG